MQIDPELNLNFKKGVRHANSFAMMIYDGMIGFSIASQGVVTKNWAETELRFVEKYDFLVANNASSPFFLTSVFAEN